MSNKSLQPTSCTHITLYFRYSCVLLPDKNTILLIGGSNRMTTIYHISSGRPYIWSDTILSRNYGKVLNLNGRILILGGDSHANRVEEYDPRRKKFKLVEARTLEVRSRFGATSVPAKFFRHLRGGCRNWAFTQTIRKICYWVMLCPFFRRKDSESYGSIDFLSFSFSPKD